MTDEEYDDGYDASEFRLAGDLILSYVEGDFDEYVRLFNTMLDEFPSCDRVLYAAIAIAGGAIGEIGRTVYPSIVEEMAGVVDRIVDQDAAWENPAWLKTGEG